MDPNTLRTRIDGAFAALTDDRIRDFLRNRKAREDAMWSKGRQPVTLEGLGSDWTWMPLEALPIATEVSEQHALAA